MKSMAVNRCRREWITVFQKKFYNFFLEMYDDFDILER